MTETKQDSRKAETVDENDMSLFQTAISPSTALKLATLVYPTQAVRVRGEVTSLRFYPNKNDPVRMYGDLSDGYGRIGFAIKPTNQLKLLGQHIELMGCLETGIHIYHDGLKLELHGEMKGEYHVDAIQSKDISALADRGRVPLRFFFDNYDIDQLCFITTKRGKKDLFSAAGDMDLMQKVQTQECRFTNKDNVMDAIKMAALTPNVQALAIARGGSASTDMMIWDDVDVVEALLETNIPFYTALGHSDQTLLADKHSDESFYTPTALGASIRDIKENIADKNRLIRKTREQEQQIRNSEPARQKLKKIMIYSIVINLGLVSAIALYFWW